MAKDTKDNKFKKDTFDDGLGDLDFNDIGGFEENGDKSSRRRGRKPSASAAFTRGAVTGVADKLKDPKFIVDHALGAGYRQAFQAADSVLTVGRSLYHEVQREAEPVVKDLRHIAGTLSPALGSVLPKKLQEKLDNFANGGRKSTGEYYDAENSEIAMALGSIFSAHQERQAQLQQQANAEAAVRGAVDSKMSGESLRSLLSIQNSLSSIDSFNNDVTASYYKKDLELSYRQLFAQRKTVEVLQQHLEMTKSGLADIIHNTELPDIVKMKTHEQAINMLKLKFLGMATDPASKWFKGTGSRIVNKAKGEIKQFFQSLGGNISDAMMGAELVAQAAESGVDLREMGYELGGQSLGGAAANKLMKFIGPKIETRLSGNRKYNSVNNILQSLFASAPELANEFGKGFGGGPLIDFLRNAVGKYTVNSTLQESSKAHLDQPALFDLQFKKTVEDIIPGFLSKISHATMITAGLLTKDAQPEQWDWKRNKFSTVKKMAVEEFAATHKGEKTEFARESLKSLVNTLDPHNRIKDNGVRQKLAMYLDYKAKHNEHVRIADLVDPEWWPRDWDMMKKIALTPAQKEMVSVALSEYAQVDRKHSRDYMTGGFETWKGRASEGLAQGPSQSHRKYFSKAFANYRDARTNNFQELLDIAKLPGGMAVLEAMGVAKQREDGSWEHNPEEFEKALTNKAGYNEEEPHQHGGWLRRARGGPVRGPGGKFGDKIKAMLSDKEFVVRAEAVQTPGTLEELYRINARGGANPVHKAAGGIPKRGQDAVESAIREMKEAVIAKLDELMKRPSISIGLPDLKGMNLTQAQQSLLYLQDKSSKGFNWLLQKATAGVGASWNAANTVGEAAWRHGSALAGGAWRMAKEYGSKILTKGDEVWVRGKNAASLTPENIAAGIYYDVSTGKPIKSLDDIKGEVKRQDTDETVLSKEDFDKYGIYVKKARDIIDRAKDMFQQARSTVNQTIQGGLGVVKSAVDQIKLYAEAPFDIYVKGETEPRLKARIFRAGGYFVEKGGKRITLRKLADINGNVYDEAGIVLSAEDARKQLVDQWGRPVIGLQERLINIGERIAQVPPMLMSLGMANWAKGKERLKKLWGGVKNIFNGKSKYLNISVGRPKLPNIPGMEALHGMFGGMHPHLAGDASSWSPQINELTQHVKMSNEVLSDILTTVRYISEIGLPASTGHMNERSRKWFSRYSLSNMLKRPKNMFNLGWEKTKENYDRFSNATGRVFRRAGDSVTGAWRGMKQYMPVSLADAGLAVGMVAGLGKKRLGESWDRQKARMEMRFRNLGASFGDVGDSFGRGFGGAGSYIADHARSAWGSMVDAKNHAMGWGGRKLSQAQMAALNAGAHMGDTWDWTKGRLRGGMNRTGAAFGAGFGWLRGQGRALQGWGGRQLSNAQIAALNTGAHLGDAWDATTAGAAGFANRTGAAANAGWGAATKWSNRQLARAHMAALDAGAYALDARDAVRPGLGRLAVWGNRQMARGRMSALNIGAHIGDMRDAFGARVGNAGERTGVAAGYAGNAAANKATVFGASLAGWGAGIFDRIKKGKATPQEIAVASAAITGKPVDYSMTAQWAGFPSAAGGATPQQAGVPPQRLGMFAQMRARAGNLFAGGGVNPTDPFVGPPKPGLMDRLKGGGAAGWLGKKKDGLMGLFGKGVAKAVEAVPEAGAAVAVAEAITGDTPKKKATLSTVVDKLEEIRSLLEHKHAYDQDADGNRIGSDASRKKGGMMDRFKGMFTGLMDKFNKKDKVAPDGGEKKWSITDMMSKFPLILAGAGELFGKAMGLLGPLGTVLNLGMKVAKVTGQVGWGAAKLAGRAALGAGKLALSVGRWAVMDALPAVAGLAVDAAMAIGSIISAPVVIGAAVIGAAIWGGMKLYQHYQNDKMALAKLRFAQYGFSINDKDRIPQIIDLESKMRKIVGCSKGQAAQLGNGTTVDDLISIFGIDKEDEENKRKWIFWFSRRFKPIYLTWQTVLFNMVGKLDLDKIDSLLTSKQKLEAIEKVGAGTDSDPANNPYAMAASPFPKDKEVKLSPDDVIDTKKDVIEYIKKHAKETDEALNKSQAKKDAAKGKADDKPDWMKKTLANMKSIWDSTKKKAGEVEDWLAKTTVGKGFMSGLNSLNNLGTKIGGKIYDMANSSSAKALKATLVSAGKWSKNVSSTLFANIASAARRWGVPEDYMKAMAMIESGGDTNAVSPTGARGIYQFIKSTGQQYGLFPGGQDIRADEAANVDAGGHLASDNYKILTKIMGQPPEPWQLYLAHQQGAGGILKILKAARDGSDVTPEIRKAMDQNGGQGLSPAEFADMWRARFAKMQQAAVSTVPGTTSKPAATTPAAPPTNGPAAGGVKPVAAAAAAVAASKAGPSAPAKAAAPTASAPAPVAAPPSTPGGTARPTSVPTPAVAPPPMAGPSSTSRKMAEDSRPNAQLSSGQMVDLMQQSLEIHKNMDGTLSAISDTLMRLEKNGIKMAGGDSSPKGQGIQFRQSGQTPPSPLSVAR